MRKIKAIILTVVVIVGLSMIVYLPAADARPGKNDIVLGTGIGVLVNPARFDFNITGEYFVINNASVGFETDIAVGNGTLFLIRAFGRYHFDLARLADNHRLAPWDIYLGGGLGGGGASGNGNRRNGNGRMDLMIPEFGFRYEFVDWFALGSNFSLHILTNFNNTWADFRILFVQASFVF